ncbi:MAG: peptidase U32 family protein [Bacillota bacterium]
MNIVGRLKTKAEIKTLIDIGLNVFLLDIMDLTTKAIFPLNLFDLDFVIKAIKKQNKKVYLLINKMIHENDIKMLEKLFKKKLISEIDGIVINDLSVYVIAKEFDLEAKIIYQPGTMNTNSYDAYYFENKIKGITLSKEITYSEINLILNTNYNLEFSILAHGYLDMFYSKRKLITNYYKYKNIPINNIKNNHSFVLNEKTRKEALYPIIEDIHGTHIFRSKKLESFKEIKQLKTKLSDIFIERLFIDNQEYYDTIKAYLNEDFQNEFLNKYYDFDKGFYYLPTEKVKGDRNED